MCGAWGQQLAPEQALLGLRVQSHTCSSPASPRPTGRVNGARGARGSYKSLCKKNINLCKAWARYSASSEHLSCSAPELGTEQRHPGRALCGPRDTMLTRLTCTVAFHL